MKTQIITFFYSIVGVVGIILLVGGILVGLYMGIWWCFIGGIVAVIEAVKVTPINSYDFACGVTRVIFAIPIGWACFLFTSCIGFVLVNQAEKKL